MVCPCCWGGFARLSNDNSAPRCQLADDAKSSPAADLARVTAANKSDWKTPGDPPDSGGGVYCTFPPDFFRKFHQPPHPLRHIDSGALQAIPRALFGAGCPLQV